MRGLYFECDERRPDGWVARIEQDREGLCRFVEPTNELATRRCRITDALWFELTLVLPTPCAGRK